MSSVARLLLMAACIALSAASSESSGDYGALDLSLDHALDPGLRGADDAEPPLGGLVAADESVSEDPIEEGAPPAAPDGPLPSVYDSALEDATPAAEPIAADNTFDDPQVGGWRRATGADDDWMMHFEKVRTTGVNPILGPTRGTRWHCPIRREPVKWEEKDVFNPAAIVKDNKVHILYRAEDTVGALAGTSRIGLAWSDDGYTFKHRLTEPVLYPDTDKYSRYEWEGGCEDPRVVEAPDGTYVMTYTAYDGVARLCVATSKDLVSWTKHGPVFARAHRQTFLNAWTKAGSIVVEPQPDGRMIAAKINGTYWMYWGEHDIHVATSTNLIEWEPLMGSVANPYQGRPDWEPSADTQKPLSVLRPRLGKFDSVLVEPGPPAILREDGILFLYNSKSAPCYGYEQSRCPESISDGALAPGTYAAGQALFSRNDPRILLDRSADTFFKPTEPYEITGQVGNVCFLQGLVYFEDKWLLYYGTADSKIAVAEALDYSYSGIANSLYLTDEDESNEELMEDLDIEDPEMTTEEREEALRERIFRKIKKQLSIREEKKKRGRKLKKTFDVERGEGDEL